MELLYCNPYYLVIGVVCFRNISSSVTKVGIDVISACASISGRFLCLLHKMLTLKERNEDCVADGYHKNSQC